MAGTPYVIVSLTYNPLSEQAGEVVGVKLFLMKFEIIIVLIQSIEKIERDSYRLHESYVVLM